MIDFTSLSTRKKTYAGANGNKIAVMYQDALYILKFPGAARLNALGAERENSGLFPAKDESTREKT